MEGANHKGHKSSDDETGAIPTDCTVPTQAGRSFSLSPPYKYRRPIRHGQVILGPGISPGRGPEAPELHTLTPRLVGPRAVGRVE